MSIFRDPYAADRIKDLVNSYGVKTIVETGTYYGEGVKGFSSLCNNVYSIEKKEEFFGKATDFLIGEGYESISCKDTIHELINNGKRVTLILGDSAKFIEEHIKELEEPILFFLDAHGPDSGDYCPILEEIRAISPKPNSLIIIHDFKVEGRDFGYDIWNGRDLDLNLVSGDLYRVNPDYKLFVNQEATSDRKYRSGILFVVPG